jgi:hypothetical protein
MSKDELADWSATAGNNTDVGGINIAEAMATGDVNNAMREIMAQLATDYASQRWRTEGAAVPSNNLNSITASGIYTYASSDANVPTLQSGVLLHLQRGTGRAFQLVSPVGPTVNLRILWRQNSDEGWSAWRELMHHGTTANGIFSVTTNGAVVSSTQSVLIDPNAAEFGCSFSSGGQIIASATDQAPAVLKRTSSDGSLVQWWRGTSQVGTVSVTNGVVSYGSFCGTHWSQFMSLAKPDILPGTIVETIDRLCDWPGETETVLPQIVVAEPKSRAVYGVFSHWDGDTRDVYVASLGAFSVRVAKGSALKRGDLIEAGPGGVGVVQADDIVRSSTVAKVTAVVRTFVYRDGSFLVPCTLHCG